MSVNRANRDIVKYGWNAEHLVPGSPSQSAPSSHRNPDVNETRIISIMGDMDSFESVPVVHNIKGDMDSFESVPVVHSIKGKLVVSANRYWITFHQRKIGRICKQMLDYIPSKENWSYLQTDIGLHSIKGNKTDYQKYIAGLLLNYLN